MSNQPLPPIPGKMIHLPRDHRGFPIPWFVETLPSGERDFRIASSERKYAAFRNSLCWVCGGKLGRHLVFAIGPMCVVNRITSEPPCHLECAEFSAQACPFLSRPRMRRNEKDLPEEAHDAPGIMLKRNPGATALYITEYYQLTRVESGHLVHLGSPERVIWYAEGKLATRAQVEASINSGYPLLLEVAQAHDGAEGVALLEQQLKQAQLLLPHEEAAE